MRTVRFVSFCLALVLAGIVGMPAAVAWGPKASRAICLSALQVVRRDVDRVFEGREDDIVAGATISDATMSRYAVQTGQVEPFQSVISQIALLRRANERGVTDYLAYRFGIVAKMTANTIQPFGIPKNSEEKMLKGRFDADIEEHVEGLEPRYRHDRREFIYYPASYFRERRKFLSDAEYFIGHEYTEGDEYGDYTERAVAKHFEEAVSAVSDLWYTILSDRKYFGETPPSPRDLAQYYAEQVDYFLKKSRPDKAEEAYATVLEVNPGLAAPYEELGDAQYRAGDYERAMEMYRRGLSMRGSWPEVEEKIVKHYTQTGATLLAKKTSEGYQVALQAYDKALEVSPGNPVAVRGREEVKAEMAALQARLARDRALLEGADRLFQEGSQAESAQDFVKAIDLYEKAAAVYTLVSSEFQELHMEAEGGSEDAARQIGNIFSTAIREAENLMSQASQRELEGDYESAMRLYDRVPKTVSMITEKYPEPYAQAQRLKQSAAGKKAAAKTNLEKQETQGQGPPPRRPTN